MSLKGGVCKEYDVTWDQGASSLYWSSRTGLQEVITPLIPVRTRMNNTIFFFILFHTVQDVIY